jgi:hypothetical protein
MIYIPCYDADRPETLEIEQLMFVVNINGTNRCVEYDTDGAFIVKRGGKTCEDDITDEQWDNIEAQVNSRLIES